MSDFQYIYSKLNHLSNLKLITIYNDFKIDNSDTETKIIDFPKLANEDFANILVYEYNMDKTAAEHISTFCEGYPRLAHYIGRSYIAKQQVLSNLDEVMKGLIIGSDIPDDKIEKTMCVAKYLSIFKKFGFSDEYKDERNCIFELIRFELPNITSIEFENIIRTLKS